MAVLESLDTPELAFLRRLSLWLEILAVGDCCCGVVAPLCALGAWLVVELQREDRPGAAARATSDYRTRSTGKFFFSQSRSTGKFFF
jgi:hypothetical protein